MEPAHAEEGDLVDDLGELVRELKVYLKWQQEEGAFGLPRDPRPPAEFIVTAPSAVQQPTSATTPLQKTTDSHASPVAYAPVDQPRHQQPRASSERRVIEPPRVAEIVQAKKVLPVLGENLSELQQHVATCTACSLHEGRKQTVFARGNGSSGLVFLGEGPGADEDEQGLPFVGAAGQLLDKMITAMGFTRDEVYVCNIVKCRPPNNRKPSDDEMRACLPFLERQLALIKPQVIVALGGTATAGLLGDTRGITKIRGKFRLYQGEIAVMPTFHPAYLLRTPAAKREVWSDLRQVVQHMGRSLPPA